MKQIQAKFNQRFAHWNITLSDEVMSQRVRGKIVKAGWCIWFLFGTDEAGDYLDYYASHRMAGGDDHIRIRMDGSEESLPAIASIHLTSEDPVEAQRLEKEFLAENQRISEMLNEKGFGLEGDEPLSVRLMNVLCTHQNDAGKADPDNGEAEAEEDCKKQEVKPNSGEKLRRLSVPKLENTDPEVHCKKRLEMQEKDREFVKKFAKTNQLEISNFLTNSAVELCYTIQCNGEEIGYVLKRWDEAGFRIGEDLVVPENRTAVFESNAKTILDHCATNGITMGTDFVGDEIIIRIDGLTYNEGFNSKTFIAAINTLRECVEEIRGIIDQDIDHKPPVKPKSKSDREKIKKKDPSIVPVERSEKLIAFRQKYQAIINSIAKKNKLKFLDSDPIDILEFNYDIERNGEALGYFSRGWGEPVFRIAELLIIRGKSKIAVFNSNTKNILDFCKNNGIGMTTGWSVKNSKKELFVAIDAVIYNEGFNSKTFMRTLNAVRVCVEKIQGTINEVDARCGLPMEPKPERQTAPKERGEVILKVGACGGSLTILGERNAMGDWRFLIAKNEVALVDMLLPEDRVGMVAYERSDYLSSLEEALQRLDRYPWFRFVPDEIHPDFLDQVLLEVKKRGGESQVKEWRVYERFFEKNRKRRLKEEGDGES